MIRYLVAFVVALLIAGQPSVEAAERKLSVFGFSSIKINGAINVNIVTGKGPSAKASADSQKALDRLQLRTGGSELIISVQRDPEDAGRYSANEPISLDLSTYAVTKITHLGGGNVTIDELKGRNVTAQVGGFGSLTIGAVDADELVGVMNGGGMMSVSGTVREAALTLVGANSFAGGNFEVEKLKLTQRGPSNTQITVEREAEINSTGSGVIEVFGKPTCLVRSAGAAEIICNPKN